MRGFARSNGNPRWRGCIRPSSTTPTATTGPSASSSRPSAIHSPDLWEAFHSIDWLERDPDEGRPGQRDRLRARPPRGAFHRGARDNRKPLGEGGVEALVDLLAPSVEIRVPLGDQLMLEAAQLEALTHEQATALRQMRRNPAWSSSAGRGRAKPCSRSRTLAGLPVRATRSCHLLQPQAARGPGGPLRDRRARHPARSQPCGRASPPRGTRTTDGLG